MSDPAEPSTARSSSRTWWQVAKIAFGLAALGAAIWAVTGKTDELAGASTYLSDLRWGWLIVALVAEAVSYLAYATVQRRLLAAGRVQVSMAPITGMSLAGTAIQNSLPGGIVFYTAYAFRQYRRFGADDILAGWTIVAVNTLSFVTLSVLASAGLAMALGAGSALNLVEVILGIVVVAGLLVLIWIERTRLVPLLAGGIRLSQRVARWPAPGTPADEIIQTWLDRLGAVSPSRADWVAAVTMSVANWAADCACLILCFTAVGAGVPWRGLLLAYGAGQLATILPITPGGLGVVEGSLTVALVTFGGAQDSTVAAVLLYRLISFWLLLPVGWGSWGALALAGRRTRQSALEPSAA